MLGIKTGTKTKNVIRVNFRTKKIKKPGDDRIFNKFFEYHKDPENFTDLKKQPGPNCYDDKQLKFFITTINPKILSSDEAILYQNINQHISTCDLCLAKVIKLNEAIG